MENVQERKTSNQQLYILLGLGLLIYVGFSILAGIPETANLGAFIVGLIIVFLTLLALFSLSWYLLFKPLPAGLKAYSQSPVSTATRQGLALFQIVTSVFGVVGGLWDVAWHTQYGLPFGVDFFWRPHQFIYLSLFSPIIMAAFIWIQTMRNGKGTLQQRFRADVSLSLLMLGGIFMFAILPMDPIWHYIYAEDLTAMSVPHTLFSLANTVTLTGVLGILLSYTPIRQSWETASKAKNPEWAVALLGAITTITLLIVVVGDWETVAANAENLPRLPALVASRPDWALPATLAFVVTWVGSLVNHSSKRFGMAIMSLILAAMIRQSFLPIFNNAFDGTRTWFVLLPMVLSLDILTWIGVKRGQQLAAWQMTLGVGLVGAVISLPLINFAFTNPTVTWTNAPILIVAMLLGSLAGIWIGRVIGDFIASSKRETIEEAQVQLIPSVLQAVALGLFVALLFAVWFISSSVPPIF